VYVLFCSCINIIFNSLLAQLVKYDVRTTRKIKIIHAIIYHILLFSWKEVHFCTENGHFAFLSPLWGLRSNIVTLFILGSLVNQ